MVQCYFPLKYSLDELIIGLVPFEIVSAGDHCDLRMSKQMDPFELMLGW